MIRLQWCDPSRAPKSRRLPDAGPDPAMNTLDDDIGVAVEFEDEDEDEENDDEADEIMVRPEVVSLPIVCAGSTSESGPSVQGR